MNFKDYQEAAVRTAVPAKNMEIGSKPANPALFDLLHCAMGLCTEAGEVQDQLKKHIFYGDKLDEVNLKEELGDQLWYIGMICSRMGWSMEELANTNIEKLKARFPDKFTEEKALTRDLDTERSILEKGEDK